MNAILPRHIMVGSGGVQKVHLPRIISDNFSCSVGEARRALDFGEVQLDGETVELVDWPVADLRGKTLSIGKREVTL
jgi:hypothetical protein